MYGIKNYINKFKTRFFAIFPSDIDDKYAKKLERMGGHGGPVMDFKEKANYKPNVRVQHFDKFGLPLDAKEAFRSYYNYIFVEKLMFVF